MPCPGGLQNIISNLYDLPTSLTIGGEVFQIRYQWRAVLDIMAAMVDPELDEWAKTVVMLQILYPDWKRIPPENMEEAAKKAVEFIDCGIVDDGKPTPRLYDWEQDASIIMPEINKAAGREIRLEPDLHWWTFFGYFMSIGEGVFAEVLSIRSKKAKGKKLERYEKDFYKENKSLIDLKEPISEEEKAQIKAEKAAIEAFLK